MFLFGYAVLLYNMWTVANAMGPTGMTITTSESTGNTGRRSCS